MKDVLLSRSFLKSTAIVILGAAAAILLAHFSAPSQADSMPKLPSWSSRATDLPPAMDPKISFGEGDLRCEKSKRQAGMPFMATSLMDSHSFACTASFPAAIDARANVEAEYSCFLDYAAQFQPDTDEKTEGHATQDLSITNDATARPVTLTFHFDVYEEKGALDHVSVEALRCDLSDVLLK
jgi:hypothetical protein